jgi:hypothetical protein
MLGKIPLEDNPLTDDQISSWLFKMNSLVNEFHNSEIFGKLPPGAWHIKYRIKDSILFVNILLAGPDQKEFSGGMSDPMNWIYFVARAIGYKIRENVQMVSEGSRVYLKSKCGDSEFSFAINGADFRALAMMIGNPLDDPGTVLASFDLDAREFDKLNNE